MGFGVVDCWYQCDSGSDCQHDNPSCSSPHSYLLPLGYTIPRVRAYATQRLPARSPAGD